MKGFLFFVLFHCPFHSWDCFYGWAFSRTTTKKLAQTYYILNSYKIKPENCDNIFNSLMQTHIQYRCTLQHWHLNQMRIFSCLILRSKIDLIYSCSNKLYPLKWKWKRRIGEEKKLSHTHSRQRERKKEIKIIWRI